MRYLYTFLLIVIACGLGSSAHAFEVRVEPDISISENYVSDQNIYIAGLRTWFDTKHQNDIVSVSLDQTIGGTIFGDVILLGNKTNLTGEYFDDVRIVANTVRVSGVVNQDLVIVARSVLIEKGAIINGDTLILANNTSILGQLLGQTQITGNIVDVAGTVSGTTTITGQRVSFLKDAQISSDISYFSPQRAYIESGAQTGQLNYNQIESITQTDIIKKLFFGFVSFWAIIKLVATLFMIFILTQLFKVFTQRSVDIFQSRKLYTILVGIISIIVIPLLIIILFGSLVLLPISLILLFVFGIMIIMLPAMGAIIVASLYQKYILKQAKISVTFNISALALIGLTFMGFIPRVGSLIVYVLYLCAFGTMTLYLYEQVRRKRIS